MPMSITKQNITLLMTLGLTVGCVEDAAGTGPTDNTVATGAILPWKVGNSWTYEVNDEGVISDKTTKIEAEESVGGTGPNKDAKAFRVVTLKDDGTDQTISWQAPLEDKVVRYREQSFDRAGGTVELEEHWAPYKLHIDGSADHSKSGANWLEVYNETKLETGSVDAPVAVEERDRWAVDQPDATVEVPAGKFEHAIVYTKAGGGDTKMYWYVRGVGKVKETGGQTEELVSYQVAE
ncbi:MAG: hypothetical protein RL701_6823 [Pseudomonadota bacterium]|jgi:hypothetical protein